VTKHVWNVLPFIVSIAQLSPHVVTVDDIEKGAIGEGHVVNVFCYHERVENVLDNVTGQSINHYAFPGGLCVVEIKHSIGFFWLF